MRRLKNKMAEELNEKEGKFKSYPPIIRPKPAVLPRERISAIKRKILGVKFRIKNERDEAPAINARLIKTPVQEPKEIISRLSKIKIEKKQETHLTGKKEIISKLIDAIKLETIRPEMHKKPKPKEYKKHFSEDGDALRKHGFKIKVPWEKDPEAKYIMPKPGSHTKHSIISHFKEAYKHG